MSYFRFLNARLLSALATLALSLFSSIGTSNAQTGLDGPDANAQPSFRFESNLVIVRVVIRDSSGNPVTGFKREEFRLFDQGKEQSISQFEEEPAPHTPGDSVSAPPPRSTAQTPRFIAFYFDDLNSSDAELSQARDAADRYLAASLQPNDRVALFSSAKVLADFTSDHEKIHQALMQLRASVAGPSRQHLCPDLSDYQAVQLLNDEDPQSEAWKVAWEESQACPVKVFGASSAPDANGPDHGFIVAIRQLARAIVNRNEDRARASLQQIDKVVELTAPAPGERSVVLVSRGFFSQTQQQSLDRIVDRALRAGVVINSLDPKGLAALMRESGASQNSTVFADPHAAQARASLDRSSESVSANVLLELAQGTGGRFFQDDNDLRDGFKALAADPPHYVLAFSPKNVKLDGKYHALRVSLEEKHKGYAIQARRGYFAVPDSGRQSQLDADLKQPTDSTPAARQANTGAVAAIDKNLPSASAVASSPTVQPPAISAVKASAASESPAIPAARAAVLHVRPGINRITANQLDQLIATAPGKSDVSLAKQFAGMELTERIGLPDLSRLDTGVPGDQACTALLLLTDAAAFLKPPASAVPLPPTPTVDEQVQWLKAAANYVVNTMGKLPNFLATRSATVFADSPAHQDQSTMFGYEPLHLIDQSSATVLFRDGQETLDKGEDKSAKTASAAMGLVTSGEFGPLLGIVLADASKSSLSWSHWERGDAGPVSVYRYAVPKNKSHYQVAFCCTGGISGMGRFQQISGYHGEISVDPLSGAVLRITLLADFKSAYPMIQADMMVEYGPVEIGGKTYICPLHSVSIAKAYTRAPPSLDTSGSYINIYSNRNSWPQQTMINDIKFEQYHVFRSDSRILPTASQPPE